MKSSNRIFDRIRNGKVALGINVQTSSAEIVEMAGLVGYDYVMLDWEHGSYGFDTLVSLIRAAECVGVTPIVRIPGSDEATVCRVLDAGAMGIVAPQISSLDDARKVIQAVRYKTSKGDNGTRGACPSTRSSGHLCNDWETFVQKANDQIFLALGIESLEAIQLFGEMADIGRIDSVFIGAFDLAQSMGLSGQMHHKNVVKVLEPLVQEAIRREIAIFATLTSGNDSDANKDIENWINRGASIINVVSDRRAMVQALNGRLHAVQHNQ